LEPRSAAATSPWIEVLEGLPFVRRATVRKGEAEPVLRVRADGGTYEYRTLVRTQPLGEAAAALLLANEFSSRAAPPLLVLAPFVPGAVAERLVDRGVEYVDLAGNCHLLFGGEHHVHVEGKRLARGARRNVAVPGARQREAGYQVLFALAARPELANAPVRDVAELAGTGKSAVADVIARLVHDGIVARTAQRRMVVRRDQLIDRWVVAYIDRARARWLAGRFRPAETDPAELEQKLVTALRDKPWGFGGSAAAMRLDRFYRGPETVVYVAEWEPKLARGVRALPDAAGSLLVFVNPMPLAFEGSLPRTVHPLLVYSELVAANDDRSLQAAARIRERFLGAAGSTRRSPERARLSP
jgi:hypothetical protein